MRGCGEEDKRNEIGNEFERCILDILTVSETHSKEKGEGMFGRVKKRISGVTAGERGKRRDGNFDEE